MPPWNTALLDRRQKGSKSDTRTFGAFGSANGINGGSNFIRNVLEPQQLASPADTLKLKQYSARKSPAKRQYTATIEKRPRSSCPDESQVQGHVSSNFVKPVTSFTNPIQNGKLGPLHPSTYAESSSTSALARRFSKTNSDADKVEMNSLDQCFLGNRASSPDRQGSNLVALNGPDEATNEFPQSRQIFPGFEESDCVETTVENSENISHGPQDTIILDDTPKIHTPKTELNNAMVEENHEQIDIAAKLCRRSHEKSPFPSKSSPKKTAVPSADLDAPEVATNCKTHTESTPCLPNNLRYESNLKPTRSPSALDATYSSLLETPSQQDDRSVDFQYLFGSTNSSKSMQATRTHLDSGLELGSRFLPEDLSQFLDGKSWHYEYGSSSALSSSPFSQTLADKSVISIDSSVASGLSEDEAVGDVDKQHTSKHRDCSISLIEFDNNEGPLQDKHTDKKADYQPGLPNLHQESACVSPGANSLHKSTATEAVSEPCTVPDTAPPPASAPNASESRREQCVRNVNNRDTSALSHQQSSQVAFFDTSKLETEPDVQYMPPAPALPERTNATMSSSTVQPGLWQTPRTPALSDTRGLSSQLHATPSGLFSKKHQDYLAELKPQQKEPTTTKQPLHSRSLSRPKSSQREDSGVDLEVNEVWRNAADYQRKVGPKEPERNEDHEFNQVKKGSIGLDDPEVLEGWDHLADFKREVELKERERHKAAELKEQERERVRLEKRNEKASKPARARQRPSAPKTSQTAKPPAQQKSAVQSLEQRAKNAKSTTRNKVERPFGADRVGKELNQALEEFKPDLEPVPPAQAENAAAVSSPQCQPPLIGAAQKTSPPQPSSLVPPVNSDQSLYQPSTPQQGYNEDPFHQASWNSPSSDTNINVKLKALYEQSFRQKERQRPPDVKKHKFAAVNPATIIPDDLLLMRLRSTGLAWKEVQKEWETRTGRQMREDALRHRYTRLITTVNEYLLPSQGVAVAPLKEVVARPSSPVEDFIFDERGNARPNKPQKFKGSNLNVGGHRTTAGKTISAELWAKILQSDPCSPSPSPFASPEPEHASSMQSQSHRDTSPIQERDKLHFVYQAVLRTAQLDMEESYEDAEPVATSDATSDLFAANDAAAEAFRAQQTRFPFDSHAFQMIDGRACWEGVCKQENKKVQVVVERGLRNFLDNVLPTSKDGWVSRTCYVIVERIIIYENAHNTGNGAADVDEHAGDGWDGGDVDALFEAAEANGEYADKPTAHSEISQKRLPSGKYPRPQTAEKRLPSSFSLPLPPTPPPTGDSISMASSIMTNRRIVSTTKSTLPAVYTAKDMANHEASKRVAELQKSLGRSTAEIEQGSEERVQMLESLSERDAAFEINLEVVGEDRTKCIDVWVEGVELKGPRNV
ncbi:MAG: hypothetical protein Q9162_001491 [Coniocarpon cinnabarinum]